MTPAELVEMCADAIERWQDGKVHNSFPFVRLVIWRQSEPSGRTVRLFGRHGPSGRLDIVREKDGGYELVALFDAAKIINYLASQVEPSNA